MAILLNSTPTNTHIFNSFKRQRAEFGNAKSNMHISIPTIIYEVGLSTFKSLA